VGTGQCHQMSRGGGSETAHVWYFIWIVPKDE